MNQEVLKELIEKTEELKNASTCCQEVKDAAQTWLEALGSDQEVEATTAYFNVLEENIVCIDDLIALAGSEKGIQYFGAETAKNIETHAKAIKANGAIYCDCPACSAVAAMLEKKEDLFK